jgi:sugar phosphate permease
VSASGHIIVIFRRYTSLSGSIACKPLPGAIFSPYAVVFVSERYGWDRLFLLLAGAAFLAGAVLIPIWNLKPSCQVVVQLENEALQPTD